MKNGLHTSNQVSSIWFGNNDKYLDNLKYKYDEKGNITEVYENSMLVARYKYDSLSRLIREDNKPLNKTVTWEYDAGGNIANRFEYEFTTANDLNEKTPTIIPYSYATSGIRDRLIEYKGEQFEYDAIGNPTIYRNCVLTWEKGRQLKSYGNIASYSYNASGVRIGKTVGTTTTQYFLDGTKILAQKDIVSAGDNTTTETLMKFIYGVDGVIGFTLTNTDETDTNYYYKKNLQGDIIAIYDNDLNEIVKYNYDAWGNHSIKFVDSNGDLVDFDANITYNTDTETNLYIALKSPFRYRSYYYDTETGLYYLNSRYYDPEIGRFINIDEITVLDVTNIALNGINLYAYCLNNPVNEVDESGYILAWLLGLLISAIVVAVVNTAVQLVSDVVNYAFTGKWNSSWEDYVGAFIGGFAGGITFFFTHDIGLTFGVMNAVESLSTDLLTNATGRTNFDAKTIVFKSAMSLLSGAVSGWVFGGTKIAGITIGKNNLFSIWKSGLTKLLNGSTSKMKLMVILKGLGAFAVLKSGSAIIKGIMSSLSDWIKTIFFNEKGKVSYV